MLGQASSRRRARPRIRGEFCERTENPRRTFDKRSFRWVKRGRAWILVGCPRGEWMPRGRVRGAVSRGRCAVGTKAYKVLAPAPRGRCRIGRKVSK